jgi:predicted anti-sigma-YlaC factor YlaD
MSEHFAIDHLADLSALLVPDHEERLEHLSRCDSCRKELASVARIRLRLGGGTEPVPHELLESVCAALRAEREQGRPARRSMRHLGVAVEATLVGLTMLALVWSAGGEALQPLALAVSVAVMAVAVAWRARNPAVVR